MVPAAVGRRAGRGRIRCGQVGLLSLLLVTGARGADLEQALGAALAAPLDLRAGNEARRACREARQVGRCVDVFDELARRNPQSRAARYNAALAYIDDLPGRTILRQGWLSTRSIEHVSRVLEQEPADWLAVYIRGLNNLYWPRWFGRIERAIVDLQRSVELAEAKPAGEQHPYHALAYVALGDAQAKAGRVSEARGAWKRGAARHPGRADLARRLALADGMLASFVDAERDLQKPIDTDVSFLWAETAKEPHDVSRN